MIKFVIFFMIVATIFALASLAYVIIDILLESRRKEKPKAEPVFLLMPEPEPEPELESEPEPKAEPAPELKA
jgi:hypothetical protein